MFMTRRQKLSIDLEEERGNGREEGRLEGLKEGRQEAEIRLQPIIDRQAARIAELENLLAQAKINL